MLKYLLNENEQEMGVIVDEKKGTEERDVKEGPETAKERESTSNSFGSCHFDSFFLMYPAWPRIKV